MIDAVRILDLSRGVASIDDPGLLERVESMRAASPGTKLGVSRGDAWSSDKRLSEVAASPFSRLVDAVAGLAGVRGLNWRTWATSLGRGAEILEHDHYGEQDGEPVSICGLYYPTPSTAALIFPGLGLRLEPFQGCAVLFGPKQRHRTEPNETDFRRVSIAFNGALSPQSNSLDGGI